MKILSIKLEHLKPLLSLPFHHKDPFDRIIIAQAISENLIVATRDAFFSTYEIATIWK